MDLLKKIGIGTVIIIFIFFSTKGCTFSVYTQDQYLVYQEITEDNQRITVYLTPENFLLYRRKSNVESEYALFKLKGITSNHLIGPFYNKDEGSIFSIKKYPEANEVWNLEMELVDKEVQKGQSMFDDVGEIYEEDLIIRDHSIEFGDRNYRKITPNEEAIFFSSLVIERYKSQTR